jgi:hypothetical protein
LASGFVLQSSRAFSQSEEGAGDVTGVGIEVGGINVATEDVVPAEQAAHEAAHAAYWDVSQLF